MKEATMNSQDPAELLGDYKELPPQPPHPTCVEGEKGEGLAGNGTNLGLLFGLY